MAKKAQFGSRIGLIAATVGSAVGLGNVWRFPAEAQSNGGAAFLLLYILCVMLLGIPVMLSEFALGRGTRSDATGAFKKLRPGSNWRLTGSLAILASYLILSFYMVVSAWTLEYFWTSLTGSLYDVSSKAGGDAVEAVFAGHMKDYISGVTGPLVATIVMILLNLVILLRGVQKGIEKMSNIMMPFLFIILLIFAGAAMTFPDAIGGLKYFFHPDFSKITPGVAVNALGQAFFSLSLGMGILITYSGYYPKDTKLTKTSVTVSSLSLLVAVMMGMIIFPAVMSFGLAGENLEGATLVFVTLPEVFIHIPGTRIWSALFFLLLLVAALTSTISLAEVSIASLEDRFKMKRKKACMWVMLPLIPLSAICSLSQGPLSDFHIFGMNIFDFLDNLTTNFMLPCVAILTCVFVGWCVPKEFFLGQLTNGRDTSGKGWPGIVLLIVRYLAPLLIAMILVSKLLS